MAPLKVIVVGGGLAGALLSNGLVNNGLQVSVYERDPENAKREGYQIRLGEYAIKGFDACLTTEHAALIHQKFGQSSSLSSTAPILCNSRFRIVLDLSLLPSYQRSYAINRVILRDLLMAPISKAGLATYDKNFDRYEITRDRQGKEKVKVLFTDGSSDTCDVLVGADGSGSKINHQLGARNILDLTSHWAFVSKGILDQERLKLLPHVLLKGPVIVFSKNMSFFFALYLPPNEGQTKQAKTLEFSEQLASFYWGLNVPKEHAGYTDPSQWGDDHLKMCLHSIKEWAPEFHTMIAIGKGDADAGINLLNLRASNKLSKSWRKTAQAQAGPNSPAGHPRVWLIGDAVHAMQPNRGMGGNQAMYDTVEMLPQLVKLNEIAKKGTPPSTEQVGQALGVYEDQMIDRAFHWVKKSGGSSVPHLNLDGWLGSVLWTFGKLIMPVVALVYKLFKW
ncbi:hypothetical protein NW762_013435 [Fusarium torreyae]|uniref:FAD-binding domain-containing protein n=1 Tax=Fusarium torreyae TaxID=1237075 RepID=A0A9W8RMD8_9HYPO|nr:hypothetical protein NW762_013435 [Fusarium torreyae]